MSEAPSIHQLAVVIPAFKADFLARALTCLVQQTDQRFNIYVCDDASPADLQSITRSALGVRPYTYKRFETNLGGVSLARNWDRCVALSNEPWIWLFSDDDLMDPGCVAAFYKLLETAGESADVLRFDGWTVDENDQITGSPLMNSEHESWLEFAYGQLMGCRCLLFMQQMVFRREAFQEMKGFLDLPLCWGTEYAAMIALSRHRGMRRIPGARMFWRISRQNISSDRLVRTRTKKLRATCLFLSWLHGLLQTPREHLFPGDDAAFRNAMDRFLVAEILSNGLIPALANWNLLSRTRNQVSNGSSLSLFKYLALAAVNDSFTALGNAAKALTGRAES
jgi:glycosyltransferase involved in cell wall biosynthesis